MSRQLQSIKKGYLTKYFNKKKTTVGKLQASWCKSSHRFIMKLPEDTEAITSVVLTENGYYEVNFNPYTSECQYTNLKEGCVKLVTPLGPTTKEDEYPLSSPFHGIKRYKAFQPKLHQMILTHRRRSLEAKYPTKLSSAAPRVPLYKRETSPNQDPWEKTEDRILSQEGKHVGNLEPVKMTQVAPNKIILRRPLAIYKANEEIFQQQDHCHTYVLEETANIEPVKYSRAFTSTHWPNESYWRWGDNCHPRIRKAKRMMELTRI